MSKTVSIIDYGMSNLLSITRAFEHVGASVKIVDSPEHVLNADYLVLPGVGAFPDGMSELNKRHLVESIRDFVKTGKPLLGVCLGMQMLLSRSYEHQLTEGIDLINGEVLPLPKDMPGFKVPNINWHSIYPPSEKKWAGTILEDTESESCFYFVHSYYAQAKSVENVLALSRFGSIEFAAAVINNNVMGTQFHPEKSGVDGLHLLKKFLDF